MRKEMMKLLTLFLLVSFAVTTVIITESVPQVVELGNGETIITVNGDLEYDDL